MIEFLRGLDPATVALLAGVVGLVFSFCKVWNDAPAGFVSRREGLDALSRGAFLIWACTFGPPVGVLVVYLLLGGS